MINVPQAITFNKFGTSLFSIEAPIIISFVVLVFLTCQTAWSGEHEELRHQSSFTHDDKIFVILSVADFIIRAALQPRVRYQKSDLSIVFIIFFKNLTCLFRNF